MAKFSSKPSKQLIYLFLIALAGVAFVENNFGLLALSCFFNVLAIYQFLRPKKIVTRNIEKIITNREPKNTRPLPGEPGYAQWEFQNEGYINFF